jgi:hypothetical protein
MSSLDDHLYFWSFENASEEIIPSFTRIKFTSSVLSFSADPTFSEGIAGTLKSGIYYFNIDQSYKTLLNGAIDTNSEYRFEVLSDTLAVSMHDDGKLKLISLPTCEEIIGFNFECAPTAALLD